MAAYEHMCRQHVMKTLRSDKGIYVNNLTISVVTYPTIQWDGQRVRGLAKDLAECPRSPLYFSQTHSTLTYLHHVTGYLCSCTVSLERKKAKQLSKTQAKSGVQVSLLL